MHVLSTVFLVCNQFLGSRIVGLSVTFWHKLIFWIVILIQPLKSSALSTDSLDENLCSKACEFQNGFTVDLKICTLSFYQLTEMRATENYHYSLSGKTIKEAFFLLMSQQFLPETLSILYIVPKFVPIYLKLKCHIFTPLKMRKTKYRNVLCLCTFCSALLYCAISPSFKTNFPPSKNYI